MKGKRGLMKKNKSRESPHHNNAVYTEIFLPVVGVKVILPETPSIILLEETVAFQMIEISF